MIIEEKLLLIQLLLEDIRGNWSWENKGKRDVLAMKLAMELKDKVKDMDKLVNTILGYNGNDGRYFRYPYPYGYEKMDKLHGLTRTIKDKSEEFRNLAMNYLTYPEFCFEDWQDINNLPISNDEERTEEDIYTYGPTYNSNN